MSTHFYRIMFGDFIRITRSETEHWQQIAYGDKDIAGTKFSEYQWFFVQKIRIDALLDMYTVGLFPNYVIPTKIREFYSQSKYFICLVHEFSFSMFSGRIAVDCVDDTLGDKTKSFTNGLDNLSWSEIKFNVIKNLRSLKDYNQLCAV